MRNPRTRSRLAATAGTVALALGAAACGGDTAATGPGATGAPALSGTIRVDGSSTVAPLSEAAAELFRQTQPNVQVTVGTSGTGGGFEKFCNGETDISDASRPIKDEEKAACAAKSITFEELTVANDALSVVVNKENDWIDCITVEQLKKIWDQGSKVNNWNQVDPAFPDVPLKLFGAGTDSGTFDYFTDEINGDEGRSRTDYEATEDDNRTVTGVAGDKGGLGYFGFTYYEENAQKLKALQIDAGKGCVAPSIATVQAGTYEPLARPLFIYPSAALLARPEGRAFVEFYAKDATRIAEEARYVPLTDAERATLDAKIASLLSKAGTPTPSA
ncbi:MAG TPA: PstS family phosphate ABC transporter substrate-binding protein [Frankiaceae bacterium]|nr:PstS family phosphate ABC transporter substrate-binding protein [Frankiaceae bacterium]